MNLAYLGEPSELRPFRGDVLIIEQIVEDIQRRMVPFQATKIDQVNNDEVVLLAQRISTWTERVTKTQNRLESHMPKKLTSQSLKNTVGQTKGQISRAIDALDSRITALGNILSPQEIDTENDDLAMTTSALETKSLLEQELQNVEILRKHLDQVKKDLSQVSGSERDKNKEAPPKIVERPKVQTTWLTRLLCARDLILGVPFSVVGAWINHPFHGCVWWLGGIFDAWMKLNHGDALKASGLITLWCVRCCLEGLVYSTGYALMRMGQALIGIVQPHRWLINSAEPDTATKCSSAENVCIGLFGWLVPGKYHVVGIERRNDGSRVQVEYASKLDEDRRWLNDWWYD